LKLETLAERRKNSRHSFLIQLFSQGENHKALISSYDRLMWQKNANAPVNKAASQVNPQSIYTKTFAYPNSVFPGMLEN